MTPEKIGRYEIIRELGEGGMAIVYLAQDPHIKRQVAVKVLPREFTQHPQYRARFQREAEIIAALEHPAIVPIHDFGEHDGQPFFVMRHMAGGSLADKLAGGSLPLPDVIRILNRLAPALDAAHQQGIIHRDLKPGNILFDPGGLAYVADFGIAKLVESTSALTGDRLIGTPAYMSPEQARGKATLDGRSDVYSLGVILFEMLTGNLPFEADTPMGMAVAHINDPVPDILSLNRDLPPACRAIIERALAKERATRYATVGELAEGLALIAPDRTPPAPPPVPEVQPKPAAAEAIPVTRTLHDPQVAVKPVKATPPRRRWLPWAGAAVAGGGLLIFALVFVLLNTLTGTNPPTPSPSAPAQAAAPLTATPTRPPRDTPAPTATKTAIPTSTQTPAPTLTPTITPLPALLVDASGAQLALIPAGSFEMGSDTGFDDEQPVHTVFLDDFYIDTYEVTNELYAACVDEGACPERNASELRDSSFAQHPVQSVTWYDAQTYCEWRAAKLPTEAQWEKAARGGLTGLDHPWGNEAPICTVGALNGAQFGSCNGQTVPVGSFSSNGYGLFDMAGNVWEWVADWYDESYYGSQSEWNNPGGPAAGEYKVLRGGSWNFSEDYLRAADRDGNEPTFTFSGFGFRCSRSP